MSIWPAQPRILEINTWPWLDELGRRAGRPLTLGQVAEREWERLSELGFDAVWLMGVWERSPESARIARAHAGLGLDFRRALPDLREADVLGSPYAIRRYVVDPHLGGPEGLAEVRAALAGAGLRLLLDFVPNHVARDHDWVFSNPEFFVRGDERELLQDPDAFFAAGGHVLACGRDPFFPPWTDVAQLDVFAPGTRAALAGTLLAIAEQCDGVRCDMAMLVLNAVFARTWGARAGRVPQDELWPQLIGPVRSRHPNFLFVAEVYWDLEAQLLQQDFDHCYDKRLYDRLRGADPQGLRRHLEAVAPLQGRLLRFLENHDEARAAEAFEPGAHALAAVSLLTLPGAKLLHEGQLEGRRVRLPVQLGRRPAEVPDPALTALYERLLQATREPVFANGTCQMCTLEGWPDNQSCVQLVAWARSSAGGRRLVVVNLAPQPAQARLRWPWPDERGTRVQLTDLLSRAQHERELDELLGPGLYVELPPWGAHVLSVRSLE